MKEYSFLRLTAISFYIAAFITLLVTIWYYNAVLSFTFEQPSANLMMMMGIVFSFMMAVAAHFLLLVVKMAQAAGTGQPLQEGAGKQVNSFGTLRPMATVFYVVSGMVLLCGLYILYINFFTDYGIAYRNFLCPGLIATITFATVIAFAGHMMPLAADIAEGLTKK